MADTAEQWAFGAFAMAHPVEAYAEWPERFWAYFQRIRPGVSRAEMERMMAAADTDPTET